MQIGDRRHIRCGDIGGPKLGGEERRPRFQPFCKDAPSRVCNAREFRGGGGFDGAVANPIKSTIVGYQWLMPPTVWRAHDTLGVGITSSVSNRIKDSAIRIDIPAHWVREDDVVDPQIPPRQQLGKAHVRVDNKVPGHRATGQEQSSLLSILLAIFSWQWSTKTGLRRSSAVTSLVQ